MAVKITRNFSDADVEVVITQKLKIIEPAILEQLQITGEEFVKNARISGNYKDQTGNLRNSIGYVILRNGEQLYENFTLSARVKVKGTGKGTGIRQKYSKGSEQGEGIAIDMIRDLIPKYPTGYVLIVVAGMNYAAAVESKGKDVLTGSSLIAIRDLKKAFAEIQSQADRI